MRNLRLCIITPEETFFDGECEMVILRAVDGDLGVLPGHAPLITLLARAEASVQNNGRRRGLRISGGFAEILPEGATVVTDGAEWI